MIKMQAIGNLGKDCAISCVNTRTVINFSVAHSEKYKDAEGNMQTRTTWVDCSYWTEKTAIAPYLKKGTTVFVEGTPTADTYINKERNSVALLRLNVREIQLIGGQRVDTAEPPNSSNQTHENTTQQKEQLHNAANSATKNDVQDLTIPF
jgi:single-strand DNA-binding protein